MGNTNKMKSIFITMISLGFLCSQANAAEIQSTPSTGGQMQTTSTAQSSGDAFLSTNKTKSGVVTLPDGLQYKVLKQGNGVKPTLQDVVTVHYAGKLTDGTEFDSSYSRGEPATFPVSGVIAGWTEALQLMKVGSVWELYIPASLAYGDNGAPPVIGPNQVLIFKVELLGIKKQGS